MEIDVDLLDEFCLTLVYCVAFKTVVVSLVLRLMEDCVLFFHSEL